MKENNFWAKVREALKKRDCYYYKPVDRSTAGCPDILICNKGIFIAVELKIDDNKATSLQIYNGICIKKAQGKFFIMKYHNDTKKCSLWLDNEWRLCNNLTIDECLDKILGANLIHGGAVI